YIQPNGVAQTRKSVPESNPSSKVNCERLQYIQRRVKRVIARNVACLPKVFSHQPLSVIRTRQLQNPLCVFICHCRIRLSAIIMEKFVFSPKAYNLLRRRLTVIVMSHSDPPLFIEPTFSIHLICDSLQLLDSAASTRVMPHHTFRNNQF